MNNHISPRLIEHKKRKKTTTHDRGNAVPSLRQAHKCGGVKLINGILTLPLDQWNLQEQCKYIHILASTQKTTF